MREGNGRGGTETDDGLERPARDGSTAEAPDEVPLVPALGLEDSPLEDLDGAAGKLTLITGDETGARGVKLEPGERWQDALHRLQREQAGRGRAYALVLELLSACLVLLGAG